MKVSIALGTYFGTKYLREQLNSLAQQTCLPAELIVGDDGSTDNTIEILEEFADKAPFPVQITRNPQRLGWVSNFLQCAHRCTGDVIAFCDQDDVWLPEKLQRIVAAFDDETLLVGHEMKLVDENLVTTGKRVPNWCRYGKFPPLRTDPLKTGQGISMVVRRLVLERYGMSARPTNPYRTGELPHDQWSLFLSRVLGHVRFIPDELVLYRQHEKNAVGSSDISLASQVGHALATGAETYDSMAMIADEWSGCLESMSQGETSIPRWRERLRAGAAHYARLATLFRKRAQTHRGSRFSRIAAISSLAAHGGYRGRHREGLGIKSLAKDVLQAARGG